MMNMHRSLFAAALVAAAGLAAAPMTPAYAATTPAAANALGGNPVPGVCMLSREAVFAQSKVGQSANERLKQLVSGQESQLESQHKTLEADIQAFQQKASTLTEAQRQQQGAPLQQRMQALQQQAQELNERVNLTRGKVMQQIGQQAQPAVDSAYTSHHCGILLNRDEAVLGGNASNDLTPDVIRGLDTKITTLNFNLEPLPAAPAAK